MMMMMMMMVVMMMMMMMMMTDSTGARRGGDTRRRRRLATSRGALHTLFFSLSRTRTRICRVVTHGGESVYNARIVSKVVQVTPKAIR